MKLRSRQWFDTPEYYGFSRKAWLRSEGFSQQILEGKPIVGIANSWSELNNCNANLRQIAEAVKRGVWAAGGVPLEFPTISLGEMFMRPTTMLYRNLMSMDVEESIRANPIDGVVCLSGCDKTVPAQIMGATSAGLPFLVVTAGPMLSGDWKGRRIGAGSDGRKLFDLYRTNQLSEEAWCELESGIARSAGTCTVMGTASTMAAIAEALGLTLPNCAAIPAPDSRRLELAERSGQRIVDMIREDLTPKRILTADAFHNAMVTNMAIGGSTNAVVHLLAMACRAGIPLALDDFDRISRATPTLANVKPSGEFLMDDFFYAGGVPALLREIRSLLRTNAITVTGRSIGEDISTAECLNHDVIRAFDRPLHPEGGTCVIKGNLAPDGAVVKQTAASPHLLTHTGPAWVFENYKEMIAGMDREDLPVTADTVFVMKNSGPKGAPGFPEWGFLPLPKVLVRQGVKDAVRISDARMSGTSFGTVVLHIAPESAIGGPLALVKTGDRITLDVPNRRLDLHISDEEFASRKAAFTPQPPHYTSGYGRMFLDHVTQANHGCDFDFLMGPR